MRRSAAIVFSLAVAAATGILSWVFLRPSPATASPVVSRKPIMVFAGAASKPALEQCARLYQQRTGQKIETTFAGSGTVLAQVVQEHIGDLYIPGSNDYMDRAEQKGAVIPRTRRVLAYLVPAILVAEGNPKNIRGLADLARPGLRVVIGQKGAVCLGDAAEDILKKAGLLEKVRPRIVSYAMSCEDVQNALLMGEADVIIGWDSMARQHPKKIDLIPIPKKYLVAVYNIPGAVITWSKNKAAAEVFLNWLTGPSGRWIFKRHGYTVSLK
ncbi:MAG: molybdate ABC transporter substrate-binding protein [Armatimonadetes bacterium]|nr:molybdate ABC transporter substrate-binding protein [Armatimonadota bacterium]